MHHIIQKKILVVDDEIDILDNLSKILKRAGYAVITAKTGQEGLDLCIENKPDLLILDIILPDISGTDVAVKLSELEEFKNIPIIFITGIISKEEEGEAHNIIANRTVICKPCDPNVLLKIIRTKI